MKIKSVALVYKKSSYELYAKVRKDHHFLNLIERAHPIIGRFVPSHDAHEASVNEVRSILKKMNIRVKNVYRAKSFSEKGLDLVITVGGDGTFLDASHSVSSVPILGVNSNPDDSVGMFCGVTSQTLESYLHLMIEDRVSPTKMTRLKIQTDSRQIQTPVLNDILITNSTPAATSRIEIVSGQVREEIKCSGIWISPAAGSTAGIRSAGGKILPIESKRFQFLVREPYLLPGHKSKLISKILKPQETLTVYSKMRTGGIYLDGSHRSHRFPLGEKAMISTKAPILVVYGFNKRRRALFK
ncbi:MAG: NAD(+)/NADH kinase [Bdellovibrionales bacterium]|nr:NAD(+)/NADH kinase [Bdellovibrionales bacterium]